MQAAIAPDELIPCPIEDFTAAVDALPAACCIVASAYRGERRGWTVTAQATVSIDPPSIMVCVEQSADVHRLILASRRLSINQLAADQTDKAHLFASAPGATEDPEFGGGRWLTLKTGAPILSDAVTAYDCRMVESTRMKTHSVFLAIVVAIRFGHARQPLIRWCGQFSGLIRH